MSAPITYPAALPCPQTSTVTPAERRHLSDQRAPREARQIQVDRLEYERITLPPMTRAMGQVFMDWWRVTLIYGGSWFVADWPLPRGWVSAVRKFREQPRWEFIAGGFWRISALCEVRGVGELPVSVFDPYYSDVIILLPFEDGNGSSVFTDIGPATRTVTIASGSPRNNTSQSKIGAGSMIPTSSSPMQLTYSAPSSGAGNWTFDVWYRRDGTGNFCGFQYVTNLEIKLRTPPDAGTYQPFISKGGVDFLTGATATPLNTWQHLEFSYETITSILGTYRIFQDGVLSASATGTPTAISGTVNFGRTDSAGFSGFLGSCDMYRLTYGGPRHTTDFTPPTTLQEYLPNA